MTKPMPRNGVIRCALISFCCAMIVFGYFMIRSGGFFTISEDYNAQSIPFAAAEWTGIREGNGGTWCWNLDLGSSLITGFSFYNLGSPFFLITLLFSKTAYPYLAGFLFVAKYVTAALFAYLYLRDMLMKTEHPESAMRHTEDYAITGALLYAFSGFQSTNLIFHFHDVTALFPLLLWGLEHIDDKKKRPLFALAVFFNCLVNYYFFVQEVIFLLVYYVFRHCGEPVGAFFRRAWQCLLYGLLGTGMAAVLFLPSILYIRGNDRSGVSFFLEYLFCGSESLLFLLKGMLLPGDSMVEQSAIVPFNYDSASCFLPFFGPAFVFAYIAKKRDWLGKLLCFLFFLSFSPMLQGVFLLFTTANQRWWYMPVLLMALATARVLQDLRAYPVLRATAVYAALVTVFYLCIRNLPLSQEKTQLVMHDTRFTQLFWTALAGSVILAVLIRYGRERIRVFVLAATSVFCIFTTALTLHWYRALNPDAEAYRTAYMLSAQLQPLNDQYRYALPDNIKTLTGNAGSYGTFSSTINNASRGFDALLGVQAAFSSQFRMDLYGLGQLLGGKYFAGESGEPADIADQVSFEDKTWYVTEGNAFPIGFPLDYYMYTEELLALPQEQRPLALMRVLVIDPQDEEKVMSAASHIEPARIGFDYPVEALMEAAVKHAVSGFQRDSRGFSCTSAYNKERLVYFTVPYDTGWEAAIDGEKAEIINTGGMMAIVVPAGNRTIVFSYKTPWFREGIALSVVSCGIWLVIVFLTLKKESNRADTGSAEQTDTCTTS